MPEPKDDKKPENDKTVMSDETKALVKGFKDEITALKEAQEDAGGVARLLADPDIRALYEAKVNGEPVKVTVGRVSVVDPTGGGGGKLSKEELDDLDGSKLAEHITNTTISKLGEMMGTKLEEALGPLGKRLKNLEGVEMGRRVDGQITQMAATKQKYPDFDGFRDTIIGLMDEKGLNAEEAYIIARGRAGKGLPSAQDTGSEKPSSSSARPESSRTRETPLPPGRQGFQQLLSEAQNARDPELEKAFERAG